MTICSLSTTTIEALDNQQLRELLDLLMTAGVKSYRNGDLSIEFDVQIVPTEQDGVAVEEAVFTPYRRVVTDLD